MPEAEQTINGDYEYLEYHSFTATKDERFMSWKSGSGSIVIAPGYDACRTSEDTEDKMLLAGKQVLVIKTVFRLKATKG
ncbi:hypothetical protein OCU04_009810 [Sclerotinia nivalis]|uniref:Uncharacterized protein n=1 Tax=Sclerotinia nivalis TaxID=352851 RepID=A0A9X0DGG7_9HELO|nr:hypothetical protein OCU04_009810 [Sclerotinia nivalis]KAJ8062030.1 hypothetical protein OCU04_009810 [Sclerotinia nivalis]